MNDAYKTGGMCSLTHINILCIFSKQTRTHLAGLTFPHRKTAPNFDRREWTLKGEEISN